MDIALAAAPASSTLAGSMYPKNFAGTARCRGPPSPCPPKSSTTYPASFIRLAALRKAGWLSRGKSLACSQLVVISSSLLGARCTGQRLPSPRVPLELAARVRCPVQSPLLRQRRRARLRRWLHIRAQDRLSRR
eukprot:5396995-Prymnesium_polylepis.1